MHSLAINYIGDHPCFFAHVTVIPSIVNVHNIVADYRLPYSNTLPPALHR